MNIIFVKGGVRYTAGDVNRLAKSLQPYYEQARFICYTDDPTGVEVETIPFFKKPTLKKWWNKLALLSDDFPVEGECTFFDLDVVVHSDPRAYIIGYDKLHLVSAYWKRDKQEHYIRHRYDTVVNSTVMSWTAGTTDHIWTHFLDGRDYWMRKYKGIDGFIYNEGFDIGHHRDGIMSSKANPLTMKAAIESWNNLEWNSTKNSLK